MRRWPAALGGLAVGVAGVIVVIAGVGVVESQLVGGETRSWCEGTKGYESTHGPLERCVRLRVDRNLVADDERTIEFHRGGAPQRWEAHPWPLDGPEAEVDFGDDAVTVTDEHGVRAVYPNAVFDDSR